MSMFVVSFANAILAARRFCRKRDKPPRYRIEPHQFEDGFAWKNLGKLSTCVGKCKNSNSYKNCINAIVSLFLCGTL